MDYRVGTVGKDYKADMVDMVDVGMVGTVDMDYIVDWVDNYFVVGLVDSIAQKWIQLIMNSISFFF